MRQELRQRLGDAIAAVTGEEVSKRVENGLSVEVPLTYIRSSSTTPWPRHHLDTGLHSSCSPCSHSDDTEGHGGQE